jgi:ubiquinone biosynthesis accessory factor UbiJ
MVALALPLAQVAISALNHVLRQQSWARDRLRTHCGRTVRMVVVAPLGAVSADARIADDGTLELASIDAPSVTLSLTPTFSALLGAMREGAVGLTGHLKVEGDVMVAAAVGEIAQHLRWDIEEDLSRLVGDVVAHRMAGAARAGVLQAQAIGDRAQSGLRQFLVDEDRQLLERRQFDQFGQELSDLEARLDRLAHRVLTPARG